MGTSYQTVLVVGELTRVREVIAAARVDGLVMPAGAGRTAIATDEGPNGYAGMGMSLGGAGQTEEE